LSTFNSVAQPPVSRRYEWTVVAILTLCFGFEFLDRLAMSYLMPIIQPELGITNSQIGLLGFVNTGFYSVSAIVFGYIMDKHWTRKKWLVFFIFCTFVATGITALVGSFNQLFIVRAFVGLAEGPLFGLFGAILINVNPRNFGRNLGISNAGVGLFAVTMGPVAVTQIVAHFTWQATYLLVSIPTFIIAFLVMFFIKEPNISPEESIRQKELLREAGGVASMFKTRNVIVCIFMAVMFFGGYWTLMLFAPVYLVNVNHFTVQQMGMVSSVSGILYIVYSIVIPKLTDNFGRKPVLIISTVCALSAPLFMAIFPGTALCSVFYVIFGGMVGSLPPIVSNIIPMESLVENLRTTANGVISGIGEFLGGSCMPVVVGEIADRYGLQFTMGEGAILLAANVAFGFGLEESNPMVIDKRAKKAQA